MIIETNHNITQFEDIQIMFDEVNESDLDYYVKLMVFNGLNSKNVQTSLIGQHIKKIVVIPGKLVNFSSK